jgi:phosphoglycolate phosphatase-like HAD superfamily hydrolase
LVLAPLGIRIDAGSWYRTFAGTGSRPIIERLFRENGVKADINEFVERRKELYASYVRQGMVKPVKGIREFLALVRGRGLKTKLGFTFRYSPGVLYANP